MASTYSDLKIELIGTGEQVGSWGNTTNTNLGTAIEEAITGTATVTFSSADETLTLTNTNASQAARNLRIVCTGTSGGARNLILGSGCQIEKLYIIQNDLADDLTVKNTTGTGVVVPAGAKALVYNDATNVIDALTPAGFDTGTRMIFAQTTAPTGWTKDTSSYNNHALRVVTGSASTGGTVDFTSAFISQSVTGNVSTTVTASTGQVAQAGNISVSTGQVIQGGNVSSSGSSGQIAQGGNISVSTGQVIQGGNVSSSGSSGQIAQGGNISASTGQAAAPVTVSPATATGTISASSGQVAAPGSTGNAASPNGNTTLAVPTIPSHNHIIGQFGGGGVNNLPINPYSAPGINPLAPPTTNTGGGGAHTHPAGNHTHPFTGGQHAHPVSATFTGTAHTHPASGGQHTHPASATFTGALHNHPVSVTSTFTGSQHAHPASGTFTGSQHAHPVSVTSTFTGLQHAHPASGTFTGSQHAHPVSAPATSNFSGTAINLAVKYLDVITATKD